MARDLVVSKVNGSNFVGLDIVTRVASVAVDFVQRFRRKKAVRRTRFALFVNGRGGIQDARGWLTLLVGHTRSAMGCGGGR